MRLPAVEEVMIPDPAAFSWHCRDSAGCLQTITLVQTRINPALQVSAILMCMFDSRTSLSTEVCEDIDRFLESARKSGQPWSGAKVIPVHIRRNIKLAEAPSHGQTIFEYDPGCNGAADYQAVAEFLLANSATAGQTPLAAQIPSPAPSNNPCPIRPIARRKRFNQSYPRWQYFLLSFVLLNETEFV